MKTQVPAVAVADVVAVKQSVIVFFCLHYFLFLSPFVFIFLHFPKLCVLFHECNDMIS